MSNRQHDGAHARAERQVSHNVIAFILLVLTPAWLQADSAASKPDEARTATLEEVVVEASRAGATALEIPVNTSILARQDVQEWATRSADEILRQVPGFSLLRSSDSIATAPTTATVSMRGLGGSAASRTLVLLDGIPLHSPSSSEVYWARIPKHRIDRVEVVRGGGANAWGNLALGGVINIITQRPRKNGIDFTGILSYPWTVDLALAGSQVSENWEVDGQVSYFDTDGYYNSPADERGAIDQPVRKEYASASGRAAWKLGENSRLVFSGSLFDEERNAGSALDVDNTQIWTAGIGFETSSRAGGTWRANLFHEEMDTEDYATLISNDREEERIRSLRVQPNTATGAGLIWSKSVGQHTVTAGADYRWTEIEVNDFSRYVGINPREQKVTDASQDMGGIFIQDNWELGEHWQLNGSLRYDYVTNRGQVEVIDLTSGATSGGEVYPRNSETTVNPSVGTRYRLNDSVSLRAAAYRGFRAPTLRELYRAASTRNGIILVNNPYLEPERLVGLEGGIDWILSARATLRLTLFHNVVEDLVQNITRGVAGDEPTLIEPCGVILPSETCRELDNVGEMESTGVELEAGYDIGNWSLFLSYLYNDAIVTKAPDNPQVVGKQVRQAPDHSFTARARHRGRWFDTSLLARYVGERYEDEINTLPVDDFLLFDLRLSRMLSERTEVFLAIDNLFDEAYEIRTTNSGATEIGRPRFVGLGLRFSR